MFEPVHTYGHVSDVLIRKVVQCFLLQDPPMIGGLPFTRIRQLKRVKENVLFETFSVEVSVSKDYIRTINPWNQAIVLKIMLIIRKICL